ncbi:hypothetical protein [Streptomyces corynorhini]|uniref:hypothetical protein n=1 Tax=Streptomyces corynorhini TaxID=2282652 RepID=UPI001F2A50B3|nr:hypothetical protein [Streptomyces corynorhini]
MCAAAGATTLLDQAVANIAIPSIAIPCIAIPSMCPSLGAGAADVQWIVAGYAPVIGAALVPGGGLGDPHGHKRLLLAGVAVFLLAGRRPRPAAGRGP